MWYTQRPQRAATPLLYNFCRGAAALLCNLYIVVLRAHPRTTLNFGQKRPSPISQWVQIGSAKSERFRGSPMNFGTSSHLSLDPYPLIQWRSSIGSDGCEAILCSLDLLHIKELISHHAAAPPATGISPSHNLAILPDGSKAASHAIS